MIKRTLLLLASLLATAAPAAVLYTNLPGSPGNNGPASAGSADRYAKSFVPTVGGQATSMTIWGQSISGLGTGNFTLELRADSGGVPGALLASGAGTTVPSVSLRTVTLNVAVTLSLGTRYWAVFYGDYPVWQNASTGTEPSPGIQHSSNSGASWQLLSGGVGPQYPLTLRVDGNPINTAPSASADGYSTNEDVTLSVPANGVLGNDSDPEGNALTAVLLSGPASGVLTLNANGGFTFAPAADTSGVVTFTYRAFDGALFSQPATVTLTVNPVNDAPRFTPGADVSVNEDSGAQTLPWATAISPGPNEASQTVTFSVVVGGAGASLFSVQPAISSTGVLTFTPAPNAFGVAVLSVRLSDSGGTANGGVNQSGPQTLLLTINPVNDAPTFNGSDVTVLEDSGARTLINWATGIGTGGEAGQTLVFTTTAGTPALFQVQPSVNLATGTLTFTPAADAFGSTTLTVTLQDNGGTVSGGVDTTTRVFNLTITPVNDAPSFVKGADLVVDEDAAAQSRTNWASAISPGNAAEAGQGLSFTVTPNDASLFQSGPALAVDGTLTFRPAADAFGTATLTVVLVDNGGTANGGQDMSAPQTFTLELRPVNDPPRFVKGADVAVEVNSSVYSHAAWAVGIGPGPANENAQTLLFSAMTDNDALFAVRPSIATDGTLTFTPAANTSGVAQVEVTLSDNGGMANGGVDTSAAQTFVISVLTGDGGMLVADAGVDAGVDVDGGTGTGGGMGTGGGAATGGGAGTGGGSATGGGMGTGGGSATGGGSGGGSTATGGGMGTGGGSATGGGSGGGGEASMPGCGCTGTEGSGLLALALAGSLFRARRRQRG